MSWTIEEAREFIDELDLSGVPMVDRIVASYRGYHNIQLDFHTGPVTCVNTGKVLNDGIVTTKAPPALNEGVFLRALQDAVLTLTQHEFEEQLCDRDGHYFFDPHNDGRRSLRRHAK